MCWVFFEKLRKHVSVWPRGSHNQNRKEIRAFSSEIIATRTTDGWTDDRVCLSDDRACLTLLTESSRAKNGLAEHQRGKFEASTLQMLPHA